MTVTDSGRARFIELAHAIRLQLGYPAQDIDPEPGGGLTLSVQVEGVWFDLQQDDDGEGGRPDTLLEIRALLGQPAPGQEAALYAEALRLNQVTSRLHSGMFARDIDTRELCFCFRDDIAQLDADTLVEGLHQAARHFGAWRARNPMLFN